MKSKNKIIEVTAEMVYQDNTEEHYISDFGKQFDPKFDEDNDDVDIHYTNPHGFRNSWQDEVKEVPIEELKDKIAAAELCCATHIGLFFHGDHGEYEIYGYNIHQETPEEFKVRKELEKTLGDKDKNVIISKLKELAAEYGIKITIE